MGSKRDERLFAHSRFRPLSGSYISQFLYQYELPQLSGFPSPIGELHFSIIGTMLAKFKVRRGFRPLSGSYISQYISRSRRQWDVTVSVPYRGATFLNTEFSTHQHLGIMFPSPIGELHFSISLQSCSFSGVSFPSPIGELHFSIPSPQPHVLSGTNRGIAGEK